jgi:hypothetical protein
MHAEEAGVVKRVARTERARMEKRVKSDFMLSWC